MFDKINGIFGRVSDLRPFVAVRRGLMMIMPLILVGSFAIVLNNLPIEGYQRAAEAFFGPSWKNFGDYIRQGTFSIMSVGIVFSVSYAYAGLEPIRLEYEGHPAVTGIVSLICLFTLVAAPQETVSLRSLSAMGVFIALLTALVSAGIFSALSRVRFLRLRVSSNATDPHLNQAFSTVLPAAITISLFSLIRIAFVCCGVVDLHDALYTVMGSAFSHLSSNIGTALLFVFCVHVLWFFGIHGNNMLESATQAIFVPALAKNAALIAQGQAPAYMFSKEFFDVFVFLGGSGATLCLIVALLIQARHSTARNVGMFSLLPGLFNINEPMTFGMPVVLNPYLLIPFVSLPLLLTLISYAAMATGLVPLVTSPVEWTTPILLGGYTATGSVAGAVLQGINFCVGVVFYLPFVRMNEAKNRKNNRLAIDRLITEATEKRDMGEGRLVDRKDMLGNLARLLTVDLREDIAKGQNLWLEYQPKVSFGGKVVGTEALLRWEHRIFGRLPPPLAVALAEDSGLIHDLGRWILHTAFSQYRQWQDRGLDDMTLAVNIAPAQLEKEIILPMVREVLAQTGVDPRHIELEITEQTALGKANAALEIIRVFKEMGMKISIDDFGMGHTSLVIIKEFQVDTIKLDGSLVKDVLDSSSSRDIISSIVYFSQRTGISIVAEYVGTPLQRDMLHDLGCDIYQGWLYSKSLMPEDFFAYCMDMRRRQKILRDVDTGQAL